MTSVTHAKLELLLGSDIVSTMTTTEIPYYDYRTAELSVGMTLPNKATVIAFRKMREFRGSEHFADGGEDYAYWLVACIRDGENFHDYACWTVFARPEELYVCWGHYFHTINEAIDHIGLESK